MTHRPSRSSTVSGHSKTKTHPQLSVKPPPLRARVKQSIRFRPSRSQQQTPPPYSTKDSTWALSTDSPEPQGHFPAFIDEQQSFEHVTADSHGLLITGYKPLDPSKTDQSVIFSVPSAPLAYKEPASSEADSFVGYQHPETAGSVVDYAWPQTPEPVFEQAPASVEFPNMSTIDYMPNLPHSGYPLTSYNSHDYSSSSYGMHHTSPHHMAHSSAQPILPTPTTAPSSTYLPPFSSPSLVQRSPNLDLRRTSQSRVDAGVPPYGQQSPYSNAGRSSTVASSPALGYSSAGEIPSMLTSTSSAYGQHTLPSQSQMAYSTYPSAQPQYVSSAEYMGSYAASSAPGTPPAYAHSSAGYATQYAPPQCWEHGCNGRQFSTFSNLLRHQREKSGTAGKSYCPRCGAEFTRTTAMKGHMNNDKCKPRHKSETS